MPGKPLQQALVKREVHLQIGDFKNQVVFVICVRHGLLLSEPPTPPLRLQGSR
jgi:hypothetical protein